MAQTSLARRIWYGYSYMMPTNVLSDQPTHDEDSSSLRADASRDGLCYVRFLRCFGDGTYQARVAARPDFNAEQEGYTLVLSAPQLAHARLCRNVRAAASPMHSERRAAHRLFAGG